MADRRAARLPATTTSAPRSRRTRAKRSPRPDVAPVTTATRPARSKSGSRLATWVFLRAVTHETLACASRLVAEEPLLVCEVRRPFEAARASEAQVSAE